MDRISVEVPSDDYWRRQIKCQEACPVHTDARGYVRAIADGRFEDAYWIARAPNPLASICGRVCGAPCEAACRRGDLDQAVSIRALKRFAIQRQSDGGRPGWYEPRQLLDRLGRSPVTGSHLGEELRSLSPLRENPTAGPSETGPSIGIIGSGPAGLAAAHDLALLGFRPTVYEMEPVPAGMLAVGIPEYRLPRALIEAEVDFIRRLGVEFICNTQVGRDLTLDQVRARHQATVIAVGLKKSRALPIPGAEGPGVLGGVELLRDVSLEEPVPLKGDVVVIGGGNVAYDIARTVVRQTGMDISRTALRSQGVTAVHLCSLESLDELPADDVEIIEGDEEGVVRHHGLGPVRIDRDDEGNVVAVVFQRCMRVFDEEGRFRPEFDEEDLTRLPAETVIWGIGQQPDLAFVDSADIERDERGLISVDGETMRTSADDVYLAGDIAYGPRLLIDAVASGKQVARSIYSRFEPCRLNETVQLVHIELPEYRREKDYEKLERTAIPAMGAAERRRTQSAVVEIGYDANEAVREGCRCLDCGVNTIFDSAKCILCGGCADVCPELCLELVAVDRLDGGAELEAAIAEQLTATLEADGLGIESSDGPVSAIIKDETRCIRCALCAERCPVGAITMERVKICSQWDVETV